MTARYPRTIDDVTDEMPAGLPIGQTGWLEAITLTAGPDAAVLVRERGSEGRPRALLSTDKLPDGERLVVMPLDAEVDVRVDGDALAVWLGSGSLMGKPRMASVDDVEAPVWASLVGGALLLLVFLLAVIGSAVTFAWIAARLS